YFWPRFFSAISSSYLLGISVFPPAFVSSSCPGKRASSNHRGQRLPDPRLRRDDRSLRCTALRQRRAHTGVKNGSGAPSVGLNTTFTFWPIFNLSISQSTKLVCSDGPSFNVT